MIIHDYSWSMGDLQDPKLEVRKRTIFQAIFCGDIPIFPEIEAWKIGQKYMDSVPPKNRFLLHGHWFVDANSIASGKLTQLWFHGIYRFSWDLTINNGVNNGILSWEFTLWQFVTLCYWKLPCRNIYSWFTDLPIKNVIFHSFLLTFTRG